MPWFRISDDATDHPKVELAGNAAFGLWVRLGSYAARQLTDGAIPSTVAVRYGDQELLDRLVAVRLLDLVEDGYAIHDYLDHNPSRAEILADRAVKKAAAIDPELRAAVKARDGGWCRFQGCGRSVSWGDRRTVRGGVLDIVDPRRPGSLDNLVVACRGCQKRHVGQAAEAAGMVLGPARGGQPPAGPRGGRSGTDPGVTQIRSRKESDPTQIRPGSRPDPIQPPYPAPSPLRGGDGAEVNASPPVAPPAEPAPVLTLERPAGSPPAEHSRAYAKAIVAQKAAQAGLRLLDRTEQPIRVHPPARYAQAALPLVLFVEADPAAADPPQSEHLLEPASVAASA